MTIPAMLGRYVNRRFVNPGGEERVKRSKQHPQVGRDVGRSAVRHVNVAARRTAPLRIGYFKSHTSGFPSKFTESLRLTSTSITTTSVAAQAFVVLSQPIMNTAFGALAGSNCAGFNKLMAVYTKCYVTNASLVMRITNIPTGTLDQITPMLCGITLATTNATLTTPLNAMDAGLVSYKQIGNNPDTAVITMTVNTSKFMSVDDIMEGPQFYCTSSAVPAQLIYANCWIQNMANAGGQVTYMFDFTATCVFADPLPVT
jgi:hypothetical protein